MTTLTELVVARPTCGPTIPSEVLMSLLRPFFVVSLLSLASATSAGPPVFPPLDSGTSVRGELVEADFIHRSGKFRTASGELMPFTMPPYSIATYRGVESDLRDIPLGTEMEFLLLPDDVGRLTRLVGTKHGQEADEAQRQRFVDFTKARGLAGWIERTSGKTLTVTFFSSAPQAFAANWGDAFAKGSAVTVCVANDELRTWQPTSCGEKGTIVETQEVPVAGIGCSGRRVVIQVNNMLEGFRQGRVVRVFGQDWKVRNQLFQECLINYGYSARHAPDFRECLARHYPEQFPYRTDYGNRHLPWFQVQEGTPPPMYSEHLMFGELTQVDSKTQSGEFRVEGSGELVKFTMLNTGKRVPAVRFESDNFEGPSSRLADLRIGLRYRFHMFQDANRDFTRCTFLSDEYSNLVLNSINYQVRSLDLSQGRIEVTWQHVPVKNYNGDMETPPPYGQTALRIVPETRVWKSKAPSTLDSLKAGDLLRLNLTAEFPGQPAHCTDLWIIESAR